MVLFFFVWIILGVITGAIASSKGRSFWGWFFFGLAIAIVAIPCALLAKPKTAELDRRALEDGGMKKCPFCAELIRPEATVCRYCSRDLTAAKP